MLIARVSLLLLLVGCVPQPWDVPGAEVHAVSQPEAAAWWPQVVQQAIAVWNDALVARGCPAPFAAEDSPYGHEVELVPNPAWDPDHDSKIGLYDFDGRISIRQTGTIVEISLPAPPPAQYLGFLRGSTVHELGHAMGFAHLDAHDSVMNESPSTGTPTAADIDAAVSILDC